MGVRCIAGQMPVRRDAGRGGMTLAARAMAVLAKYGSSAHMWLPGVGYVNGLQVANFKDSSLTPTGIDDVVGYVGDIAHAALGPELVSNGTFDAGLSGWTVVQPTAGSVSPTGGGCRIYSADGSAALVEQTALIVGRSYLGTMDVVVVAGSCSVTDGVSAPYTTASTSGSISFFFVATSTKFVIRRGSAGVNDITIDNVSVRELPGAINQFNTTTAQKPFLRRGAVNLITKSSPATATIAGSNGTMPAGWVMGLGTFNGVTRSIVGVGNAPDGTPFMDVQFSGTFLAAENLPVTAPPGASAIPSNAGYVYTASVWWGVVSGTLPAAFNGLGGVRVRYGNPGLLLQDTEGVVSNAFERRSRTTTAPAGSTVAGMDWLWSFAAGQVINCVIRFGPFQFERGASMSDYIENSTNAPKSSQAGGLFWDCDGQDDCVAVMTNPLGPSGEHFAISAFNCRTTAGNRVAFSVANLSTPSTLWPAIGTVNGSGAPRVFLKTPTVALGLQDPNPPPLGSNVVIESSYQASYASARSNGRLVAAPQYIVFDGSTVEVAIGRGRWNGSVSDQIPGDIYGAALIAGVVDEEDKTLLRKFFASLAGVTL
jgi:hypothetical protein